jgi:hypothetical protein
MRHVLDELERAAKQSDSRMKTTTTFALTTAGLLLKEKATYWCRSPSSPESLPSLASWLRCSGMSSMWASGPADVLNGRACLIRKEFYAKLAGGHPRHSRAPSPRG